MLIFEGPSYTLPWWSCSNLCVMSVDVTPQNFHWKRGWVLSNMPFFLIPLSTFWNRFLHPPTNFFLGERKTLFVSINIIYIHIIYIYISIVFFPKLRTSVVNLKTARRSSSSGDQSILGSTVSAGPWWGCEVWWKNYEDGTTNGVFPWMVGGKVTLANHVTSWWFQIYFIFIPDPGEGFHFD